MAQFVLNPLTLSNINRFSKFFHCQNQEKICNNIITKDPTTPQVCRYTTLWNISVLKATIQNKTTSATTHFKKVTTGNNGIRKTLVSGYHLVPKDHHKKWPMGNRMILCCEALSVQFGSFSQRLTTLFRTKTFRPTHMQPAWGLSKESNHYRPTTTFYSSLVRIGFHKIGGMWMWSSAVDHEIQCLY